jgi:Fe-S-cluster containining protein
LCHSEGAKRPKKLNPSLPIHILKIKIERKKLIPPQPEDPRPWLADYLDLRARLASQASDFQCDPACARPGCKNQDLQVPVSLVDLLGVALHRDERVSELNLRHYVLGVFCNDRDDWIRLVSLKLKKPCPFLDQDLCGIYPVRPLPCMLFPEYLVSRGTFAATAARAQFRDYLCLRRPLVLSPGRARVVAKLRDMWERELLISSFYLFNHTPCHIDFSNLATELFPADQGLPEAESEQGRGQEYSSSRVMDTFFQEHLAGCPPFHGVAEKIHHLDTREGQVQFLTLLRDDSLVKKLRQAGDDRALVFQYRKGKLKAKRRGIVPTEYKFY